MSKDLSQEPAVIENIAFKDINNVIAEPTEKKPGIKWFVAITLTSGMMFIGVISLYLTFALGTGMWGNNVPVAWGFPITNFVFWIGIGHAGTLISAILYLLRQKWRTGISRFAEAMTIIAVIIAGTFPVIHLGRPWYAAYVFPYPNVHRIWVNFNSPLVWDVFAVSTYFIVSFLFWYIGLIPDLAVLRDRTDNKLKKIIYSVFSLGWRYSAKHWKYYEKTYLLFAGLATPLVVSVHTIVSFDFAVSLLPGWHSTIFPPYFVTGAVFSGFAMVNTILIFVRFIFDFEKIITIDTLEKMNKVILLTSSLMLYTYILEVFMGWYSGNNIERFTVINRMAGYYFLGYWIMIFCNAIVPQLFWIKKIRRSIPVMFIIVCLVNLGMWLERYLIITTSLSKDFLPSSWHSFVPSPVDFGILIGSFGFFFTCILLFVKLLPSISIAEVKGVANGSQAVHGSINPSLEI